MAEIIDLKKYRRRKEWERLKKLLARDGLKMPSPANLLKELRLIGE